MPNVSKAKFNKVSIVEALRPDVKKTGELIFNELKQLECFHGKGLELEFISISTRDQLLQHFENLTQDALSTGSIPILQVEAHGTDDKKGLALGPKEWIAWTDLENHCRSLNVACQGNLILVMATCFGMYSASIFSLKERAPFWALIGPFNAVLGDQILNAMSRFYTHLYDQRHVENVLAALNTGPISSQLQICTAELLFKRGYQLWIDYTNDESSLTGRIENIVKRVRANGYPSDAPIDRESIKAELRKWTEEPIFDELIKHYFMVDLYPKNADKFTLTYNVFSQSIQKQKPSTVTN